MANQDFFSRQQNTNNFSSGTIRQTPRRSHTSWIGLIIVVVIFLGSAGFFIKSVLFNQSVSNPNGEVQYSIGTAIEKDWILKGDWDLITYTHSLTTSNGERFLLKSSTIPLNNYSTLPSKSLHIIWTVESYYQELPLVEVHNMGTQISWDNDEEENTLGEDAENPWIYVEQMGIGFPAEFFDQYAFVGEPGKNEEISIKNLDTEKITTIKSFECTNYGENNCKELTRTFENSANKKVTTLNGDTFYKLAEIQSRYFQNGEWRGYFINDADDEEVEKIKNLIIIANPNLIKDVVNRYGVRTCLGKTATNETISSHQTTKTNEGLKITMIGKGTKNFSCEAMLDLAEPTKLKFIDIQIADTSDQHNSASETPRQDEKQHQDTKQPEQKEPETPDTPKLTPSTDTPVQENKRHEEVSKNLASTSSQQFPINLEKALTYTSQRGNYKITFPSPNISFSSDPAQETFGQAGGHCWYVTKVIQYKDEDKLQTAPSVSIYECSFKSEPQLNEGQYIINKLGDKYFVIQIHTPSWQEFAKNIQITLPE